MVICDHSNKPFSERVDLFSLGMKYLRCSFNITNKVKKAILQEHTHVTMQCTMTEEDTQCTGFSSTSELSVEITGWDCP